MKKIIAIIMVVVSLFSVMSISAYAEEVKEENVIVTLNEVEFIFEGNTSEDFRNNFIAYYFSDSDDGIATCGVLCSLFGHKLESSIITTITHKAKATDPRCLRETYDTEACTRCDYTDAVLIDSAYISCCA